MKNNKSESLKLERVGIEKVMNSGYRCTITEYNSHDDITVVFDHNGEVRKASYGNFIKGNIKSYMNPNVYGVGIKGQPEKGNSSRKIYNCWHAMLSRCYSDKYKEKHPTYKECYVCDEWLYFPNFKNWYKENYYQIDNLGRTDLDKDILIKGNKVYSPNTCVFVPEKINKVFTKVDKSRGDNVIGVSFHKQNKKYTANCNRSLIGSKDYIGIYETEEQAFNAYKKVKEDYISFICETYKDLIPKPLYDALLSYNVSIDD